MIVTRFAPSPNGPLHLGHAFSALFTWHAAQTIGGTVLLRIEDIDPPRAQAGADTEIIRALEAYGFAWDGEVYYQSRRLEAHRTIGGTYTRAPRQSVHGEDLIERVAKQHAQHRPFRHAQQGSGNLCLPALLREREHLEPRGIRTFGIPHRAPHFQPHRQDAMAQDTPGRAVVVGLCGFGGSRDCDAAWRARTVSVALCVPTPRLAAASGRMFWRNSPK